MRRLVETVTGPKGTARIRRDAEWDEWTVDVDGQGEESRYHTDDKGDAQSHADALTGSTAYGADGASKPLTSIGKTPRYFVTIPAPGSNPHTQRTR